MFDERKNRRFAIQPEPSFPSLAHQVSTLILERLEDIKRPMERCLVAGLGAHEIARHMPAIPAFQSCTIECMDAFNPSSNYDFIISLGELAWTNDVRAYLGALHQSLKEDGGLLLVLPGGETLHELRYSLLQSETTLKQGISPRIHPSIHLHDLAQLLQLTQLALPVADFERMRISFASITDIAKEIRAWGLTNLLQHRERSFAERRLFVEAEKVYHMTFPSELGIQATFDILFGIGWKFALSQPKPLKPGQGKVSLIDVL